MKVFTVINILFTAIVFIAGCKGGGNFETTLPAQENPYGNLGKDSVSTIMIPSAEAARGPIVNITDTSYGPMKILYLKDSALNDSILQKKIARIIDSIISPVFTAQGWNQNGLPVIFFQKIYPPYFFEIGLPVTHSPAKLPKGLRVKTIDYKTVVIAHFYGPRHLLNIGYGSIKEYMNDRSLDKAGDPFIIIYPKPVARNKKKKITVYDIRTDIIFPVKAP